MGGGGTAGHPADTNQLAAVVPTFEAVADSWRSVSAPAVSRVMSGAPERKIATNEITFGGGFLQMLSASNTLV